MVCVTSSVKRRTLKPSQTTQHHIISLVQHILPDIDLFCCLVVHYMVGWLTGILYLQIILLVQRSLTVPRPGQAFHDIVCECRIPLAIFPTVTYRTYTVAASRRGVPDGLSLQRYTQV